jgi:hypothetical protein
MLLNFLDFSVFFGLLSSLPAYLDPGSGSFILQVLIASLVGIGFTLRAYWGKITKFFKKDTEDALEEELDQENE